MPVQADTLFEDVPETNKETAECIKCSLDRLFNRAFNADYSTSQYMGTKKKNMWG